MNIHENMVIMFLAFDDITFCIPELFAAGLFCCTVFHVKIYYYDYMQASVGCLERESLAPAG